MNPIYEDQVTNIVHLSITANSDWREDGYSISIKSFIGSLDIDGHGGEDDINLIKRTVNDCEEEIFKDVEDDCYLDVVLAKNVDRDISTSTNSFWYEVAVVTIAGLV